MAQFYADRVAIGSHRARTPEGYLLCTDVPFARTGFQIYREDEIKDGGDPAKQVTVVRPFDEVLSAVTMASFEGKPITSPHPPFFINPQNHNQYSRGHVQNVHAGPRMADGEYSLVADLLITDAQLIDKVENDMVKELSAGYDVEYIQDDNDPKIYRQTKIRGNHIAVVPSGRAGNAVKILDAKEEPPVAEAAAEEKVSLSTLKGITEWFRGLRSTTDAESEAVERNERVHAEALERARRRNYDAESEKEKEMEKEKEESALKKATDAFNAATAAIVEAVKSLKATDDDKHGKDDDKRHRKDDDRHERGKDDDKRRGKDADEEEYERRKREKDADKEERELEEKERERSKEKVAEKDADLIPVETLTGNEVPRNPIPGADKALDHLRAIRPLIAKSKDAKAIADYNDAVRVLKGHVAADGSAYASLLETKKPDSVSAAESRFPGSAVDNKTTSNFEASMSKFHRRNISEVASEAKEGK